MFTDEHRLTAWQKLSQLPLQTFNRILTKDQITQAASGTQIAIGRGPLNVVNLAFLAVFCALEVFGNFTQVLGMSVKLLIDADQTSRIAPTVKVPKKGKRGTSS